MRNRGPAVARVREASACRDCQGLVTMSLGWVVFLTSLPDRGQGNEEHTLVVLKEIHVKAGR